MAWMNLKDITEGSKDMAKNVRGVAQGSKQLFGIVKADVDDYKEKTNDSSTSNAYKSMFKDIKQYLKNGNK